MTDAKSKPVPPKRKGGAIYPRINLEDAITFSRKLVSKTHVAPQPYSTIFPGVFGVGPNNTVGQVRASALKQYGLLTGKPEAYAATELARKIATAPQEELAPLLEQACGTPRIFKLLLDTFHGDSVSIAKLKQQAAASGVHPDESERCANLFVESAQYAKVGTLAGETITLRAQGSVHTDDKQSEDPSATDQDDANEFGDSPVEISAEQIVKATSEERLERPAEASLPPRATIQVNVTLDSTLDTEKLEKQLALLRKYGAI